MGYYTLIITFIAALVHGIFGFGFMIIATPLISLIDGVKIAVLSTIIPTFFTNLIMILLMPKSYATLKFYIPLFVFAAMGSFLGTKFLIYYPSEIYKIFLAILVFIYLYNKKKNIHIEFLKSNNVVLMCLYGFFAGIVSGLVNIMLPVIAIYLNERNLSKAQMITIMNGCFLVSKVIQILTFGVSGSFENWMYKWLLMSVIISIAAIFIGKKISDNINTILYTKILNITLFMVAIILILQACYNIYSF